MVPRGTRYLIGTVCPKFSRVDGEGGTLHKDGDTMLPEIGKGKVEIEEMMMGLRFDKLFLTT
jgi:hypothetical protein